MNIYYKQEISNWNVMAKTNKREEATKGLVAGKLSMIDGNLSSQNVKTNGITWFKEDSYKGTEYDWLSAVFSKASKKHSKVIVILHMLSFKGC